MAAESDFVSIALEAARRILSPPKSGAGDPVVQLESRR